MLTDHDVHLFKEGTHGRLYEKLGCTLRDGGARSVAVTLPPLATVFFAHGGADA